MRGPRIERDFRTRPHDLSRYTANRQMWGATGFFKPSKFSPSRPPILLHDSLLQPWQPGGEPPKRRKLLPRVLQPRRVPNGLPNARPTIHDLDADTLAVVARFVWRTDARAPRFAAVNSMLRSASVNESPRRL